jgi:hypothetical protein
MIDKILLSLQFILYDIKKSKIKIENRRKNSLTSIHL